jgi:hypothetical protein
METEIECFDLIDRIGNEFGIDTSLFVLQQAAHWHDRAEYNYSSIKEALKRNVGGARRHGPGSCAACQQGWLGTARPFQPPSSPFQLPISF